MWLSNLKEDIGIHLNPTKIGRIDFTINTIHATCGITHIQNCDIFSANVGSEICVIPTPCLNPKVSLPGTAWSLVCNWVRNDIMCFKYDRPEVVPYNFLEFTVETNLLSPQGTSVIWIHHNHWQIKFDFFWSTSTFHHLKPHVSCLRRPSLKLLICIIIGSKSRCYSLIVFYWHHATTQIWVSCNGLLPYGNKPLPESM